MCSLLLPVQILLRCTRLYTLVARSVVKQCCFFCWLGVYPSSFYMFLFMRRVLPVFVSDLFTSPSLSVTNQHSARHAHYQHLFVPVANPYWGAKHLCNLRTPGTPNGFYTRHIKWDCQITIFIETWLHNKGAPTTIVACNTHTARHNS